MSDETEFVTGARSSQNYARTTAEVTTTAANFPELFAAKLFAY